MKIIVRTAESPCLRRSVASVGYTLLTWFLWFFVAAGGIRRTTMVRAFPTVAPVPRYGTTTQHRQHEELFASSVATRNHRSSSSSSSSVSMIRNVDLPEALVFYGRESFFDLDPDDDDGATPPTLRRGVARLLREASEVDDVDDDACVPILLTESRAAEEVSSDVSAAAAAVADDPDRLVVVVVRSSLDGADDPDSVGRGLGHAPSPGALLDALASVEVRPLSFGGSAGFGSQPAEARRPPLPARTVVFVRGPNARSRARCDAARMAGTRVVYVEDEYGSCDAEDLADYVAVGELGENDDDDEIVSLDDVSTPGSYWLNPPCARDAESDRVVPEEVAAYFYEERRRRRENDDEDDPPDDANDVVTDETDEDDLLRILADLDPL